MLVQAGALQASDPIGVRTTVLAHELDRGLGTGHADVVDCPQPRQRRQLPAQKGSMTCAARSSRPSCRMVSMVATAIAQASGFPWNVLVCIPGGTP